MSLVNKRILITAGPTWVAIDKVRVISNTASAETGLALAAKLTAKGAKVTLLLGPVASAPKNKKIRAIRFNFFDELKNLLCRELKTKKYDALIHSAAVSDYRPAKVISGKLKSGLKNWKLYLKPTPKIIDAVKKIDPGIFLAGFKFEPGVGTAGLIKSARQLALRSRVDLTVANTVIAGKYRAYLLYGNKISPCVNSKQALVNKISTIMGKVL